MNAPVDPSVLVYDVGGSHISAAVCHKHEYRLGKVVRADLPTEQTSEAFVEVLHSLGLKAANGVQCFLEFIPSGYCTRRRRKNSCAAMGCNTMEFCPFTTAGVLVRAVQFGLESESQLCNW